MTTVLFVHGACVRDAEWWWRPMVPLLAARGLASRAVPLPSCGERGGSRGDLYDDVAAVRTLIADAPVVLVGHSYGGVVITEAGASAAVTRLVYVASLMPDTGDTLASIAGAEPAPWMDPGADGTVGVHADIVRERFLQDCDAPTAEAALARLTRQSAAAFAQPPRRIAWHDTPWTFVTCTEDLAIPAQVQRARSRDPARTVDFRSGHHPFLARPAAFADLLTAIIAEGPG